MEKITIKKIARYTTSKDGTPLISKTGKPYTSVRISTREYPDKIISGFGNATTDRWQEGDKVEVEIEKKGEYLNFSLPKKSADNGEVMIWLQKIFQSVEATRIEVIKIREHQDFQKLSWSSEHPEDIPPMEMEPPEDSLEDSF